MSYSDQQDFWLTLIIGVIAIFIWVACSNAQQKERYRLADQAKLIGGSVDREVDSASKYGTTYHYFMRDKNGKRLDLNDPTTPF